MDAYKVQQAVHWVFRDPFVFLRWIKDNVDLEYPYDGMNQEEVNRDLAGRTKTVRLFLIYARHNLDRKCRIKTAPYGALIYIARTEFLIELPEWVQILDQMEVIDPSETFTLLYDRMERWANQQAGRLSWRTDGRDSTR